MLDPIQQLVTIMEAVLHRTMSVADFAHWLYTDEYATLLLGDDYDQLLSIDYLHPDAIDNLDARLLSLYQRLRPVAYEREYLRRILCRLAHDSIDLVHACAELAYYRMHGHPWIPIVFTGLDSELDAAPDPAQFHGGDPEALAHALREAEPWVQHYRQQAKAEAQSVLQTTFPTVPCPSRMEIGSS
jgi:hypothetical protein